MDTNAINVGMNLLTNKYNSSHGELSGANFDIFDDIILNLKIIGKIPCEGKITTYSGKIRLDNPGSLSWLYRWWRGDSRHKTISHIKNIINNALSLSKSHRNSKKGSKHLKRLEVSFSESLLGLQNLIQTYQDDTTMVSSLDIMIDKVKTELVNISNVNKKKKEKESSESPI